MVRHSHGLRPFHEPSFGKPEEELVGGSSPGSDPVRHVHVKEAVAVHVGHRRREAVGAAQDSRGRRNIHEAAALVAIEAVVVLAVPAVAGHVEVRITVAVVVEKERGPPAARIEKPGIDSRGREGRGAVLAQTVSVERMRVPNSEGEQIQISVPVEVGPAAGPSPRPALDPDVGRDLLEANGRLRAAIRNLEAVALGKR